MDIQSYEAWKSTGAGSKRSAVPLGVGIPPPWETHRVLICAARKGILRSEHQQPERVAWFRNALKEQKSEPAEKIPGPGCTLPKFSLQLMGLNLTLIHI